MRGGVKVALAAAAALGVARLLDPGAEAVPPAPTHEPLHIEIVRLDVPAPDEPDPPPRAEPVEAAPAPPKAAPPPPAPASREPERAGEVATESESEAVRPAADALARGSSLLRAGAFPRMRASYRRIGFAAYRDAVLALGGAFYLYDPLARRVVAEVDLRTGALGPERVRDDLSRWPRDVTRHAGPALTRGAERYGSQVSRVVLLPPARLDAALLGALEQYLRQSGLAADQLLRVDVAYELVDGRLHCEVLTLGLRDGSERDVALRIDLGAGAVS